jgi:hypothetical protein
MKLKQAQIKELLGAVFDELQTVEDAETYQEIKDEFIFHMTDWLMDLQALMELYEQPEQSKDKAASTISGFLYHVIPHLNAAGRLLLDRIPDPFKKDQDKFSSA